MNDKRHKRTHRDESFGGDYDLKLCNSTSFHKKFYIMDVCKKSPEHKFAFCFWHIQFVAEFEYVILDT